MVRGLGISVSGLGSMIVDPNIVGFGYEISLLT